MRKSDPPKFPQHEIVITRPHGFPWCYSFFRSKLLGSPHQKHETLARSNQTSKLTQRFSCVKQDAFTAHTKCRRSSNPNSINMKSHLHLLVSANLMLALLRLSALPGALSAEAEAEEVSE